MTRINLRDIILSSLDISFPDLYDTGVEPSQGFHSRDDSRKEGLMKFEQPRLKNQRKQNKPFFKLNPADEKRLHLSKQPQNRLRIVQSVSAGRVRGGHSFH